MGMFRKASLIFAAVLSGNIAMGSTVNVRDFGAKGDGQCDDSSAIQKAINNLQNGDVLYFPKGQYVIGKTENNAPVLSEKSNIRIIGDGSSATQLQFYYNGYVEGRPISMETKGALTIEDCISISVSRLGFVGKVRIPKPSRSYSNRTSGLIIDGSAQVSISDITANEFWGNGLVISSSSRIPSQNIQIENSSFSRNRISGVWAENVDQLTIVRSRFESNGQKGDGGTGYGFAGSSVAWLGYPKNVTVKDSVALGNIRKGIDFHAGVNIQVLNNEVSGNGLYGINVEGPNLGGKIQIIGNRISNMGGDVGESLRLDMPNPYNPTDYTRQLCAICAFIFSSSTKRNALPAKDILITQNKIRRLDMTSSSGRTWGIYPFMFFNMDGANADTDTKIKVLDNLIEFSNVEDLFFTHGFEKKSIQAEGNTTFPKAMFQFF